MHAGSVFRLPLGLGERHDAPSLAPTGPSSSTEEFTTQTLMRRDGDRHPGIWTVANDATQLQERLTLEVAHAFHLLSEPAGEIVKEQRIDITKEFACRSRGLAYAFALDQAGFDGFAEFAAWILIGLYILSLQGDEARRAVTPAMKPMQNVLMLVVCRGLTLEELGSQGLPVVVKERLAILFLGCMNEQILSRLGVAKYHLFNDGVKFSRRRARTKPKRDIHFCDPALGSSGAVCGCSGTQLSSAAAPGGRHPALDTPPGCTGPSGVRAG